tara:strand:+ start:1692 stop:2054 length:363 start_codon:yes stop_codon:yes gene_type:complete
MKLREALLREAGQWSGPYTNYHGHAPALFSTYNSGYKTSPGNKVDNTLTSKVDSELETQLIDQAIELLFSKYPSLIQDKKIRRHHINMLLGKISNGDVNNIIDIENFIKRLWKQKNIKTK